MKLIIFLLGCAFGQEKIWGHTCQEVPLIEDFNLKKYAGTWYEAGRYSMKFQSDQGHCGIVYYGEVDATTISVNNSEIEPGKKNLMKRTYIIGDAVQPDENFPNKLTVKFDFQSKVANFFYNLFSGDKPNYFVMETDYKKYSLVMNCDQGWFSAKVYAWIMIRDQKFSQTTAYQELKTRLAEKYGLLTDDFIQNDVDNGLDCAYDYIEYY